MTPKALFQEGVLKSVYQKKKKKVPRGLFPVEPYMPRTRSSSRFSSSVMCQSRPLLAPPALTDMAANASVVGV